jgi:PPOX class probable FMN-dependent enzyme
MAAATSAPVFGHTVSSQDELAAVYGPPIDAVQAKVVNHLDRHCREFIALSPFVLVATADRSGRCDVSPKGGPPGFVEVCDDRRLAIPDAPGNRLIDSLRNIVDVGRAGLLFLIPGMEETLRVNGRAFLTRDPALLARYSGQGKPPRIAVGVVVEEAFLHCAKAFKRSALWQPNDWPSTETLAPPAEIWRDHMALDDVTLGDVQELVDDDYRNNLHWR